MIEVTLNKEDKQDKQEYPKLMIDVERNMVVLFTSDRIGTVVEAGTSDYDIGDKRIYWVMSFFTPYKGSITLQNN